MTQFIVLAVTDVVCLLCFSVNQTWSREKMVNDFPILLFLFHTVGKGFITNQFVNDGFKDNIEVLDQQVFFLLCVDEHLPRLVKERITKPPQFQGFVREILVFDLLQSGLTITFQIGLELLSLDKVKLATYLFGESVGVADIIQYGEEDDQQFLIEVYCSFLVYKVQIDGTVLLYNGGCRADGMRPVYLVEAGMKVFQNEEEKVLVLTVELYQGQQNVQIGIAQSALSLAYLGYLGMIDDGAVVSLVVLVNHDGPINPYRKLIDEIPLFLRKRILFVKVGNILRLVFAEDQFLPVRSVFVSLQQYFGKNKYAVLQKAVVIIAYIVYRHLALYVG